MMDMIMNAGIRGIETSSFVSFHLKLFYFCDAFPRSHGPKRIRNWGLGFDSISKSDPGHKTSVIGLEVG